MSDAINHIIQTSDSVMNRGYAPVDFDSLDPATAQKVMDVMIAAKLVTNANGLRTYFNLPPAVALAIVKALA